MRRRRHDLGSGVQGTSRLRVGAGLSRADQAMGAVPAGSLGCDEAALAAALGRAHSDSIGRHRRDLSAEELADVEAEADVLLETTGY